MWQVIQDGLRVKFRIRHLLVVAVVVAVVSWLGSKYVHSLTALAEAKRSVAVPDDSFWLTDDEEKLLVFYDSSKLVAFEIQFQQRWLGFGQPEIVLYYTYSSDELDAELLDDLKDLSEQLQALTRLPVDLQFGAPESD